jgi:outer membrane immunogenic protein
MKKLLLATSCLALSCVAAQAQVAPPVYNWTGFYVGGNVGAGKMTAPGSASNQESLAVSPVGAAASISLLGFNTLDANGTGAVAGGQFGYNYQMGNWVIGVEGEGFWSGIKLTNNQSVFNSDGTLRETFGSSVKNNSDFTIAGRLGVAFDRTLIYGKGGWAWGDHKFNSFESCCNATPTTFTSNASGTLDGLLVGIGIEHALMRNVTIKFEYDHISFGSKELLVTECSPTLCLPVGGASFSSTKQIFKVGANYLFNVGP